MNSSLLKFHLEIEHQHQHYTCSVCKSFCFAHHNWLISCWHLAVRETLEVIAISLSWWAKLNEAWCENRARKAQKNYTTSNKNKAFPLKGKKEEPFLECGWNSTTSSLHPAGAEAVLLLRPCNDSIFYVHLLLLEIDRHTSNSLVVVVARLVWTHTRGSSHPFSSK